ncbi:MAG: thiosulfate sulfurtransferase GlpE [Pseudohongiellaceae bacterium]|nr:thiosulfate sulfurtransferase GlpE [Pseudohongiellaceae bacterium]
MGFSRIDVGQAKALIQDGAIVVDIRDGVSFSAGAIEGAIHIDNDNVQDFVQQSDKTRALVVCCYHGNSSQGAAEYFSQCGFEQCYSLDGGFEAWAACQS